MRSIFHASAMIREPLKYYFSIISGWPKIYKQGILKAMFCLWIKVAGALHFPAL